MTAARPSRHCLRATVLVVGALALIGGGTALASSADRDTIPTGTVQVDGQATPILGSFAFHQFHMDTNPEIRGLVHGVRRVDGATVLYYSIGTPAGGESSEFSGSGAFPDSVFPYGVNFGVDVELVDSAGLAAYHPLYTADKTFTTHLPDLDSPAGDLRVGFAVFPELPASVHTVQVIMPWGTAVGDVPVEDGALKPVGKDRAPLLGKGWPAVPSRADLAGSDPAAATDTLVRRTGDAGGATATEESPKQVATTLNANVLFASGSPELSPGSQQALAAVAADIKARGTGEVVVTGYTDSDGSDATNQTLSEQRASAVLGVLQPASGSGVTFVAAGKGESDPVAGNDTDEGKQANRRVTVVYSVRGKS